jgi:LacI family transcriptional regulator
MGVTINDVAKKAGVSHTTVSWVIHDDPRITAATKKKVMAAIRELDYHPNLHARSLVRGKTNTIALVATEWSTSFESRFLKGLEQGFPGTSSGYEVQMYSLMGDGTILDRVLKDILFGNRADAVILVNLTLGGELAESFRKKSFPLILVEEEAENAHIIKMDNVAGARLATNKLVSEGRHHIALVSGDPQDPMSGMSARERVRGFREIIDGSGGSQIKHSLIHVSDYHFETGETIYRQLRDRDPFLDAVFCAAGDMVALGIMRAAIEDGLRIPDDLAIIGYDNLEIGSLVDPPLSTVSQPIEQLGRDSFALALDLLKDFRDPATIIHQPELMIRASG